MPNSPYCTHLARPMHCRDSERRFGGVRRRECQLRFVAEGLLVHSSRGDKTPLELFLAGVHSLPADLISATKALATIDPAPQDAYAVR